MKHVIITLAICATGASAAELHHSQPSKDIFADTFITGLTDSTVLFPWGNQICDSSERVINTHGIGKSYDKRIKILPNTAQNGSTALWVRSRDGAWIVIQSNNVGGGRTCIAAKGDAGTKLPNITIGRPATNEPGYQAPAASPATREQLVKACAPQIRASRADAIAMAKEREVFFRGKPSQLNAAQIAEALAEARKDLAEWTNNKLSDIDWFMSIEEWVKERHGIQRLRDDYARLSTSYNEQRRHPGTMATLCGMRVQMAALEGV